MVAEGEEKCRCCGGKLKKYDTVKRIVKSKRGKERWIELNRLRCKECRQTHRELPSYILPYKHYEKEIIMGVREGLITSEVIGFEDYPCEMTMLRWRARELHLLL